MLAAWEESYKHSDKEVALGRPRGLYSLSRPLTKPLQRWNGPGCSFFVFLLFVSFEAYHFELHHNIWAWTPGSDLIVPFKGMDKEKHLWNFKLVFFFCEVLGVCNWAYGLVDG